MLLTSWLYDWSGRARFDANDVPRHRRRPRPHEVRRWMAPIVESLEMRLVPTTIISLNPQGDLFIQPDVTGSNEQLQIQANITSFQLSINDPNGLLSTNISGATTSPDQHFVQIPFSSFSNAQRLIVNTLDGDDFVQLTVVGSGSFGLSPVIDGGSGNDSVEINGDISVATSGVDALLNGEDLRLRGNVTTVAGKVTLIGHVVINQDVSITTGGGDVLIAGQVDPGAGSSTYTLISTPRSYADARTQAGLDVPGGHLVTIRSSVEQSLVAGIAGSNDVWIGASDEVVEGEWRWDAGPDQGVQFWSGNETGVPFTNSPSPPEYANWITGVEPDNFDGTTAADAAYLSGSDPVSPGGWRDGDVTRARPYVVESPTLFGLTINAASGMVNLNGSVGNFLPLKSLSVTAGVMQLFGGSVSTAKAQTYDTSLNLMGPTLLRAEELDFNGGTASVTGNANLTMAPIQRDAPINIGAATDAGLPSFDVTDLDIDALATGFATIFIGEAPPRASSGSGGSIFQSTGPVTVTSSTFLSPLSISGGSISVTELNAGTNKVELLAASGSITDGGDAGTDITAGDLYLDSSKGVGTSNDALETTVSAVSARAKDSGGVFAANTGNLSIGAVAAPGGIFTNGDVASVSTSGSMTVRHSIVTNGGDVTLAAADGISIDGVPIETAGGQFMADADSNNDGSGTFSILSLTDFVDWTSNTLGPFGTFSDGSTVSVFSTTFASATAQVNAHDTRFSDGNIYSPAQASGDFVETHFMQPSEAVTFSFSNPQFGLFLHFDGMQYQVTPFPGNPINLYSFNRLPSKVSGDSSWTVEPETNSIRQLTGNELADQDGTVRFDGGVDFLTLFRSADGVTASAGGDNQVNLQLGLFRAGGIMTVGGAMTIRAADIDVAPSSFLMADSGLVSLIPSGSNRTIDLGGAGGSGQFALSDAELDRIASGTIQIGDANSGTITVSDSISRPATTNLNLTTGGNNDIVFSGSNATLDSNNGNVALLLNSAGMGAITSGGALKDVRGSSVSLISGSGGIGASDNAVITDTSALNATTSGNASMFLEEIDSLTIDPMGLSAGTGVITLTGGTFRLGNANRIDDNSRLSVAAGATFQLNGFSESVSSLTGGGSVTNGTASAATLTVNLAGNGTFSGVLGGPGSNENNFGLTKSGAGTLTLSGADTYTGNTQVSTGTMLIHGSVTSNVTVASGATVGGTGTINSGNTLTVQSGGTVAPGASPGILNSGSVSLDSGSTFSVELNGTTLGTLYDQLNVTGSVTIGPNVTLSAALGFTPSAGDAFVIINNDGSDAVDGTFNGLPKGALLTLGSEKLHIVYNYNSGDGNTNDVALIANQNPVVSNQSFSISETKGNGSVVGTVVAMDADSAVTFAITGGNTANVFAISPSTGEITVNDATGLNFETNPTFNLIVEVTDDSGAKDTATIAISVINAAPTTPVDGDASPNRVSEGAANGDTVGIDANSSDVHGGAVTFSLTDDAGGRFTISSSTGVVTVANAGLLNFESATSHTITVQASDGTNVSTQDFTITVNNVPPAIPTDADPTANSVSEGAINGDLVGIDANSGDVHGGAVAFSLTDDAGGRFTIHPVTGIVRVANASLLDFEFATSHLITIQVSDGTASTTSNFTIAVTNVAPTAPIDGDNAPNAVSERVATGDPVGIDVNSGDVHGGTIAFSLTDDAGGRFAIDSTTGVVTVADRNLFDFSVPAHHTIVVQASDGTDSSTKSFTITQVSSTLSAPVDLDDHANTVPEGVFEGSRVGITLFATDPEGGVVYYRLTDDSSGRFTIDPLTGVVTVKEGRLLQFAEATQYTFRAVAVSALGFESPEAVFTVNVTQVPVDALPLASILPTRVSVVEGDSGPNFIEFLVKLNKPSETTITIDFSTRLGDDPNFIRPEGITADTPFATDEPDQWDFFRSAGRLTFDPGVTEQTLRVQIRPDDVPEENELFFVQLRSPVNAKLATQQSIATARILDDDSTPQLIVSNTQVLEGDSPGQNELVFNVQLIGEFPPGTAFATTDFATGNIAIDNAVAGTDYTAVSGTLTFTDIDRQQQVRIPILGNTLDESDKIVSLRFTNPVGLALSRSEVVGTILNDDSTTNVVVSISPTVAKVREDNTGSKQIPFVVTLVGKPADAVTVEYATADGTATAGSDYAMTFGLVTFTSADIASGVIQKMIFVTVNGDTNIEPDETFTVTLALPSGTPASISINPDLAAGKVVIRNDDQAILTEDGDALALALSDDLTTILGNGPKSNPALLAALRTRALDIIRTQGLTKAIVIIVDPVDFVLTDTNGRQSGYTEGTGVVNQIPGTYYSGDGAVELMIVPLPPDGSYNVQLAGLGGDFNASVTILDSNGTSTSIISQNLSDGATSSFTFQVGERATIPVGLGLATHSGAAPTVGVVGAFGQFGLRLALAAGQENAERNGLNLENADARSSEWMSWLSTTVRAARRELLEPLWQTLESPLGNLWANGLPLPDGIPAAVVDHFWSQIGQTLTGVPSGIYRLGDMLESLLPKSGPNRNRSTTPRAGEQGQPNRTPANPGVKAKRSALERPRSTPANAPNGRGSSQPSSPSNKSNTIKDKAAQSGTLSPGQQQSNMPRTHWLWFAFKDESTSTKPEPRRGV